MYQITKLKYVLFLNLIVMTLLLGSCGNETTTSPKIGYLGFYLGDMKDTVITKLEDLKKANWYLNKLIKENEPQAISI